eukprot:scaffold284758_cov21-Tisochrysis_lutea.AAC.1
MVGGPVGGSHPGCCVSERGFHPGGHVCRGSEYGQPACAVRSSATCQSCWACSFAASCPAC